MHLADRHNFGQQVEKVLRGSDHWYRKPRTVYWEWLFFGNTSPLRDLFNLEGGHSNRPLADYFFNLDIEIESTWTGFAKEIQSELMDPTLEHFYAFGALIAYCYVFGIRDLHKQNIVMTKTHFQPVDAEVVFVAINLPHETLLLPFKQIGYEFAGIGVLAGQKEKIVKEQLEQLVLGYWDLFTLISKQSAAIDTILSDLNFREIPSRVIVRNTSEYASFLNSEPKNALPSEIEQLLRGDIPFYFKFIGDKQLYWLKGEGLAVSEKNTGMFQDDIYRHGLHEPTGWCSKRSSVQFMLQGLLFLIKQFEFNLDINLSQETSIEGKDIRMGKQIFSFRSL